MKYSTTIILISVTVTLLIGGILLVPTLIKFVEKKTDIAGIRAQIENQNDFLAQLKATEAKLIENDEIVAKIENALPLGPDAASLLDFLDESAERNGVNLEQIIWLDKNTATESRVEDYIMSISFSGSYYSFINFINDVEKSSRIIDINQIEFSAGHEAGLPIEFKLYLKIHSYKQ
jgi:Tfp pilus assembly protein PilO